MASPDIRPAAEIDFAALSVVAAAAYAHAYAALWASPARLAERLQRFTPVALRAWAADAGVRLFAPLEGGVPVGFMGLHLRSPSPADGDATAAEMHRLYLLPSAAGRGLGRALLAVAESEARADGASSLWLKCMAEAPARTTYARWGFLPVGEAMLDNDIAERSAMVVMRKEIAA